MFDELILHRASLQPVPAYSRDERPGGSDASIVVTEDISFMT